MTLLHQIVKGNTRTPFGCLLVQGRNPVDLTGLTVKAFGKKDDGTTWFAERETGVTAQPTFTFTADTSLNRILRNDHLASDGRQIVLANSGGGLPGGLTAATRLFVVQSEPNSFGVAGVPGGNLIDLTSAGTGTHSFYIVGHVSVAFESADVASVGVYWLWINVYQSSQYDTFPTARDPADRAIKIEIVEAR